MRIRGIIALAGALVGALAGGPAAADDAPDTRAFVLVNNTERMALTARFSIAASLEWDHSQLGPGSVEGGYVPPDAQQLSYPLDAWLERRIDLGAGFGPCLYDLTVTFETGEPATLTDLDLCQAVRVELAPPPPPPPAPPPPPPPPAAMPDLDRGLPICPGDPRCKKK